MFCYQCEQTSQCTGCTSVGVCGKTPETASLQDIIVYLTKGISIYAHTARLLGESDPEINDATLSALFMTLTNVNFDEDEHVNYINYLAALRTRAKEMYEKAAGAKGIKPRQFNGPATWEVPASKSQLFDFANTLSILGSIRDQGPDITGLREMVIYGIKGMAAYAHHAAMLGYRDEKVIAFVHEALAVLCEQEPDSGKLLELCLKTGEMNLRVMELLDTAHTETLGSPVPTSVLTTHKTGKCILVSGHDMRSLLELLKQTEGKGVDVYTHGEMLPAHGYPVMKKFSHLRGNFGSAWQNQVKEFEQFPGSIVMTTNCLKPPAESYKDRLYTIDVVGWEGIPKVKDYDFTAVIEKALSMPGFTSDEEEKQILVGFGHNAVLNAADQVIQAVKAGKIKHFFLVGGCDGAEYARNYFTDFAEQVPEDCMILTLGCGKYRFNNLEFGEIDGLPRLLDLGQCNDAHSAVVIAKALAGAFDCSVNDLPLSLIISWFEQKAVAVLLSLLHLGIKDIRLGPNLPAFVTPNILKILSDSYQLKPVTTASEDIATILAH
jgi:hydroxylamine reductase